MNVRLSLPALGVLLAGCANTVSGPGGTGGTGGTTATSTHATTVGTGTSSSGSTVSSSSTGGDCVLPPASFMATTPAPECQMPESGPQMPQSDAEIRALLVGRWLTCSPGFPYDTGSKGLEIACDGTWYLLYEQTPGTLTRGTGFQKQGTWTIDPLGGTYPTNPQLNFDIFGSGTAYFFPAWASTPRKMTLVGMGGNPVYAHHD